MESTAYLKEVGIRVKYLHSDVDTLERAQIIRDIIMVTAEAEGRVDFASTAEEIKRLFKSRLNVTPKVTIVSINTLPRSEKKTKRVFDHREE